MRIEILKGKANQWYWRMVSKNGKILANSETYCSKVKAVKAVTSIVTEFCLLAQVFIADRKGILNPGLPCKA